ncbi:MAG: hypothetical protein HKN35_08415 [Woeseia sp.]|nr:hypothetical protein [Woeseia sp.]MBT8097468.1 hypothetical protein [Woeseia sp.]NNE60902.1 hypothetical protein [Woeseia sp.]NNL53940.1 hypothetical protein [Woeseia sp.]
MSALNNIEQPDLSAAQILKRFRAGAHVVCLRNDPRLNKLCDALLVGTGIGSDFWPASIFDLARNHIAGETNFGDVLRFVPGEYGHLARKLGFYPDPTTGKFIVYPDYAGEHKSWSIEEQETFELAWSLAMDVLQSASSKPIALSDYAVTIELLKYPESAGELQSMLDLISDSSSRWSRWGRKIDRAAASACGPFRSKYARHLYALLSLVPGIGAILRSLNARFLDSPFNFHPAEKMIVGQPHTDGSRLLTMLTGHRNVMTTEFFANGSWTEIPVNPTTLAIFPAKKYEQSTGVRATVHRYLINRLPRKKPESSRNATILIGVISRTQLEQRL